MSDLYCYNIGNLYEADQFICSKCGIHLEDWVRIRIDEDFYPPIIDYVDYIFKYCPECGTEIKEDV